MPSDFSVKTAAFEGPLELLLSLIEKRKLFINEISLAAIAEDYIAHIRAVGEFSVRDAAHFVLVASTLILIKSRSLLPSLTLTPEEEGNIQDLELRLTYYQHIRGLSLGVRAIWQKAPLFFKEEPRYRTPVFIPDARITPEAMRAAARQVIGALPKPEKEARVPVRHLLSLEDAIRGLEARIKETLSMGFRTFSGIDRGEKALVVVNFLALLELVRRGVLAARQDAHFGDIEMEAAQVGVPQYTGGV